MNALVATALGLAVGLGVLLLIQGIRGKAVVPSMEDIAPGMKPEVALAWFSGGLLFGLLVFAVTGWIVLAVALGGIVMFGHRLIGGRKEREIHVARTEAIASWAEMIRDNMAAAAGLEQALTASAAYAPEAIQTEVKRFANRVDRLSLVEALRLLAEDLDHPSADLIVVSLANAARMEARELGPLLSRLAESIRGDVRMRLRVEVGRARIRTSARIVVITTLATILFMFIFSRDLLSAYDTLLGQAWLVVVLSVFAMGAWLLKVYGKVEMPERFSARRATYLSAPPRPDVAEEALT